VHGVAANLLEDSKAFSYFPSDRFDWRFQFSCSLSAKRNDLLVLLHAGSEGNELLLVRVRATSRSFVCKGLPATEPIMCCFEKPVGKILFRFTTVLLGGAYDCHQLEPTIS